MGQETAKRWARSWEQRWVRSWEQRWVRSWETTWVTGSAQLTATGSVSLYPLDYRSATLSVSHLETLLAIWTELSMEPVRAASLGLASVSSKAALRALDLAMPSAAATE